MKFTVITGGQSHWRQESSALLVWFTKQMPLSLTKVSLKVLHWSCSCVQNRQEDIERLIVNWIKERRDPNKIIIVIFKSLCVNLRETEKASASLSMNESSSDNWCCPSVSTSWSTSIISELCQSPSQVPLSVLRTSTSFSLLPLNFVKSTDILSSLVLSFFGFLSCCSIRVSLALNVFAWLLPKSGDS
jgi:hypothetical protein